jgi:hypothetical protein
MPMADPFAPCGPPRVAAILAGVPERSAAVSVWSAVRSKVLDMDSLQPGDDERRNLDRLVDAQLRAEHDADIEAILALMSDAVVHDVVGLADNPVRGLVAVRRRYQAFLGATVHLRDEPLARRYGAGFVIDEHVWSGRLTGRAFDIDGHGRQLDHRVLWLLEVADGRIVREVIWNDVQAIRRQLP